MDNPSDGIRRFIYDPSWCVIVVRVRSQQDYRIESTLGRNIIVLDPDDQDLMNSEFVNNLPKKSLIARRNAGYLYAVTNGAKFILDFDDTSEMKFWIPNTWSKSKHYSINDYEVPNNSRLNKLFRIPNSCKNHEILFYEKSVKKNMDIGSIHSLIDHIEATNVDKYPKTSPSSNITVAGKLFPKGVFIPFGTELSLYYPLGFWSLYVPVTLEEEKQKFSEAM
ncbi:uncharacterized protein [Lepeophtheirus salmonis]|uniref:uncharacterized protein n=1 Tax=Lepeophtheirus salmonis TaxID=72036 RepID=UPI003AF3D9B5